MCAALSRDIKNHGSTFNQFSFAEFRINEKRSIYDGERRCVTLSQQAAANLQGLISTAAERVKTFVMTNIVAMKPRSSAGASNAVVRRQSLLDYSEYIVFLQEFAPASHRAVLQRYCEDNGEYLLSTVRAYTLGLFAAVDKRQKPALLTAAESGQRLTGLFSGGAGQHAARHP
jgi:hypothetical protein